MLKISKLRDLKYSVLTSRRWDLYWRMSISQDAFKQPDVLEVLSGFPAWMCGKCRSSSYGASLPNPSGNPTFFNLGDGSGIANWTPMGDRLIRVYSWSFNFGTNTANRDSFANGFWPRSRYALHDYRPLLRSVFVQQ
jgi:hypothetical protein